MAPKRAFGGVLRPFGGGFRGPNRERASVFSGAGRGRAGGSAVEPGRDQRVQRRGTGRCRWFCGGARRRSQRVQRRRTGAVQAGVLRRRRGRGQRVQRWGPVRDGGGTGGGSAAQAGAGPACSAARDRGGTGSSEVQTGRAGRREGGGGHGQSTAAPPPPKGRCGVQSRRPRRRVAKKVFRREDAPAARTQKKCSEGKVRRRPNTYGHKKNGPRSVHFHSATLLPLPCYPTGCCSGMLVRYTLPHDNGSALREPVSFAGDNRETIRQHVLLQQPVCLRFRSARRSGVTAVKASAIRSLSRSAARRSGLSRLAAGISAVRVAPRESLRPPPGSQFSAAGVTVLSRPGSRPSAARNLPSLLLAPSAAGVTAPPRQYGRPPATGESPASSLRRASPARDSTAYRPAP